MGISFDIVVAADSELGIGRAGTIPWRLPSDMAHFRELTRTVPPGAPDGAVNAVIMGRVTWESIPERFRPLRGRINVILSRRATVDRPDGVLHAPDLDRAVELLATRTVARVFVIGGAEVYAEVLARPECRTVYLTRVTGRFGCDRFLAALPGDFRRHEVLGRGRDDGVAYAIEVWRRPDDRPNETADDSASGPAPVSPSSLEMPVSAPEDAFGVLAARGSARCLLWTDVASGLRAVLVIDSWALGPAAGGIRTRAYPSLNAAIDDAARLARAMTLKCSLGRVDAGGAKVVVIDHPGLDRRAAFARLGQLVSELGGRFLTAGDLGTTVSDLEAMAEHCEYVVTEEDDLADAVARGLLGCARACADVAGKGGIAGMRVAIQGCGAIGAAVARILAGAGAELLIADIDRHRAENLAREVTAEIARPEHILTADVDLVCPCAIGGVITAAVAEEIRAWAVCGAANNIVADRAAELALHRRGILHVPDIVASAGAVVDGVGQRVMGLADRGA
ncbi:MAG: dihydrofolate reductase, partial [Myxococcota bacterium]